VQFRTFLLFLAGVSMLSGAETWPLPYFTSDPKAVIEAAAKREVPAGEDVFALDAQTAVRIEADGKVFATTRLVLRPVTESGAKTLSSYSQPWRAWRESRPQVKARVITPDGSPHMLDISTWSTVGIPNQMEGIFTDTQDFRGPLPAVVKDAVVEMEIAVEDHPSAIPIGGFNRATLPFGAGHWQFTIDAPEGAPLHISAEGIKGLRREETKEGGRRHITLSASDLAKPENRILPPPDAPKAPAILFTTSTNWQQVASWYAKTVDEQMGVAQPSAPADPAGRIQEIAAILADIQKSVRYTGVEFGMAAFVPRRPAETLSRGFGDCKDKSALLASRLRKAGIAANLALLNPEPYSQALEDMPGIDAFVHAIVYLPGPTPCGSTRPPSIPNQAGFPGSIRAVWR
jgi:hypothetical protein